MESTVNRRQLVSGAAVLSLAAVFGSSVATSLARSHQGDVVTGSLSSLGLPELSVTATNDSYTLSESEIAAGRYLITFDNQSEAELYAAFLQLDDVVTIDSVNDALAQAEQGPPPEWLLTLPAPGGSVATPGSTATFILDLQPGTYAVQHNSPGSPLPAAELTVTGEFPAEIEPIETTVAVDMIDMAFDFTGQFVAGSQLAAFSNAGAAHHFAVLIGVPDGTTIEDFFALGAAMAAGPEASPVALNLTFEDIRLAFETTTQSPGTTMWADITLDAGTHILSCFVFDPEAGAPHSMLGMTELFVVE